jgi:hypothetical protein
LGEGWEQMKTGWEKAGNRWYRELLKGKILGSRIPDIFHESSGHFWLGPILFGIFKEYLTNP